MALPSRAMALMAVLCALLPTLAIAAGGADEAALLAFRAELASGHRGGGVLLASWNSSTGFCGWEGVTCSRRRSPPRVVELSLSASGLAGTLSPAIGNLTFLRALDLSYNELRDTVPASLGRLRRLRILDLGFNSFSGELPANLSACTRMEHMLFDGNHLVGRLPVAATMAQLRQLRLKNNSFTGPLPASLANLSSLRRINVAWNQLDGPIPPGLANLAGLLFLELSVNKLHGELPLSLYNLSSLRVFHVEGNRLHGSIPADIGGRFPVMKDLSLANNQFTGGIPPSLSNLTTLTSLQLSINGFTGLVPHDLGRLQGLEYLYMPYNLLEADDREGWEFITSLANCSQMLQLSLSFNSFSGHLPSSVANLSATLQYLYLSDVSGMAGGIPEAIGNLVGLRVLGFGNTSISGAIPESIGKLTNLVELALYRTKLSGLIPVSLGNLTRLSRLIAYSSNLEGSIPTSIGNLKNLNLLDLSANYRLNGSIPKEILVPSLSLSLNLSYSSLSGSLPSEVGNLVNLNQLILSGNQLSGQIPDSIGNCIVLESLLLDGNLFEGSIPRSLKNMKGLLMLNLTMNKLSGTIPDDLSGIDALQELYIAHNNLSGLIPADLQNLTSLLVFDASFNSLQGEVPTGGVFGNLTAISVAGNNKLCGGMPQLHLASCVRKKKTERSKSLIISLATISAMLLLVSVTAIIWKLKQRRTSQRVPPTIVDEQYQRERISYRALFRGTDGFSESNLLGKGRYGAVYKCTLYGADTTMAVKVFNLQQSGSSKSFEAECEALRMVRHRCLTKIITCCSSIDAQGQEFKALVFELMPNGSLEGWLHPKHNISMLNNTLSLDQRLDISVDIMDALEYLHNHCQPPIIHCDLKPSNILLAGDMSARVADFGISRILAQSTSKTMQNSNSTIGIRGTIGYVAPEYGEGCTVSTAGDVYGLGILLLEMFTGRSPTDEMFIDSLDLHRFSEDALPHGILEIADPTMGLHNNASDNIAARSRIQDCLVSVIQLGVSCSKQQPRDRMPTRDAAVEMHAIRDSYMVFASSLAVEQEAEK